MFIKSWEGDLTLGGSGKSSSALGNVWHFSVTDRAIIDQLNDLPPFTPVRLHYKKYLWTWRTETSYLVNKVDTPHR